MKTLLPLLFLLTVASLASAETDVVLTTEFGDIRIRLDDSRAPLTTANFLRYVDAGHYVGAKFYRVVRDTEGSSPVRIAIVQGGLGAGRGKQRFEPIALENTDMTGLKHLEGTVSKARTGEPASATSEFFICLKDEPELDAGGTGTRGGPGYAPFGRVVEGMDIVRRIYGSTARGQQLSPPIKITQAARADRVD